MKKVIFLTAVLLFISGNIFPQNEDKNHLDSLFNEFVKLKSHKPEIKLPTVISSYQKAIKCGLPLYTDIKFNFNNFTPEQRAVIRGLDVRPVLQKSVASPYGFFRIHYDTTGFNKPGYDGRSDLNNMINEIAKILDSVYNFEINYLGYPAPPKDNGIGGDDLYDIYIDNTGNNYGVTFPETPLGNNLYTSYIEINNSFPANIFYTSGFNAAKVTLAHEFHHAIQMGNYKYITDQDTFFYELTSTSMEEFVFSSVNDYYGYIGFYFNNTQNSFSQPADAGYSLVVWNIFLHEHFGDEGFDIIKRQWELFRNNRALTAINLSLDEHQTSFKEQLNKFGIWCYFTGYRKIEGEYFVEGRNYPLINPTYKINFPSSQPPWMVNTKPLSNNYLKILCTSTYIDTIYSLITNGDFTAGLNSPSSNFKSEFSIYNFNEIGSKHISNNYYSKFTVDNNDDYIETNIFNNSLIDTTYYYEVIDFAFPNPFRYSKYSRINLPVEFNPDKTARYYIYSIDMKLVVKGLGKIETSSDNFVVKWNCLDNNNRKLSSGVYIYVTDSADKIKKGKIVIFNE